MLGLFAPPGRPPVYGEKPPVAEDGYVSHTEECVFDVSLAGYAEALAQAPLESLLNGDGARGIQVESTTPLGGAWAEAGSRRRINFRGGHYAAEEVLAHDPPRLFRYQTWGFTSWQRLLIDYLVGQFQVEETVDGRTHLTWTYSLHKRSPLSGLVLPWFVDNVIAGFMRGALRQIQRTAERRPVSGETS